MTEHIQLPEGWPRNKKELQQRLTEPRENLKPKQIMMDEYKHYRELADFECPWGKDHRDCWPNQECPKRPDPCVECPSTRKVDWARETSDKKIIEEAWREHEKNCADCTLWMDYEEERTYRETCERMKHAQLMLYLVQTGGITIFDMNNHSGLKFQ